jgi:hypothetical protein
MGALTSWNPQGLPRPVQGQLYLYLFLTFSVRMHIPTVAIPMHINLHALTSPSHASGAGIARGITSGVFITDFVFSLS